MTEITEIARRTVEAAAAGDFDGFGADLHDDVIMDMSAVPDGGVCHGRDEVLAYLEQHRQAWGEIGVTIESVESAGERVVVVFTERNTGQASGIEVADRSADLFEFDGARIARVEFFSDPEDAMTKLAQKEELR